MVFSWIASASYVMSADVQSGNITVLPRTLSLALALAQELEVYFQFTALSGAGAYHPPSAPAEGDIGHGRYPLRRSRWQVSRLSIVDHLDGQQC